MDIRVARRYARALFAAAKAEDGLESVESDLESISAALTAKPEFRKFLYSPVNPRSEKLALIERVFSDRVTALTMQMVRLLLDKGREEELEDIRHEFVRLRRAHDGILFAQITSATDLDDAQRQHITSKLQTSTGKKVEAVYLVDPRLIGGVKVAYDNYVLDGTVKGSLVRMKEKLLIDLLKQG